MKYKRLSLILTLFILSVTLIAGCTDADSPDAEPIEDGAPVSEDAVETDDEKFIQFGFATIDENETLQSLYDFADGMVIGKITDIGEPYRTDGGKIDSSIFESQNKRALEKIRVPFEVTVMYSCKGDFEVGDTFTFLGINGPVDGYTFGYKPILPIPENGGTYLLALGIYSEDEIYVNSPSLLKIDNDDDIQSLELDSNDKVEPLYFKTAYEGIENVGDLIEALDSLETS